MFGRVIYRESFDEGPPQEWTVGKNKSTPEGECWHRNILGHYGGPRPLGWSQSGGRSGGYAFSESPWYFDDNHGEFCWFHIVFRIPRSEDVGIAGEDLRGARIQLSLRGRELERKETKLFFWIQGPAIQGDYYSQEEHERIRKEGGLSKGQDYYAAEVYRNWALTSQPLEEALQDEWTDVSITLTNDEHHWSQLGLINGGLRRKIRVIQSLTSADGTLDEILGGRHWNWGFLLCGVDPLDQPSGKIDIDEFSITVPD